MLTKPSKHDAINPTLSATVSASAGTGKTWLLVSRIIRLLIDGARPEAILAITFTRKAAAEMQTRLSQRLCEMATCDDTTLDQQLQLVDAPVTSANQQKARQLYEHLLHATHAVKLTTFHAFCQDVLKRFPFEANVPPGFELIEQTVDLEAAAWDALINHATRHPDSALAEALELLFEHCNGLANTQNAISNFLQHRSDWWAFIDNQNDPLDYAVNELQQQLGVSSTEDPLASFFTTPRLEQLTEFSILMAKHPTASHLKLVEQASQIKALVDNAQILAAFEILTGLFLTKEGKPRARKTSKAQLKKMGDTGEARFLELHTLFCQQIETVKALLAKLHTLKLSRAWYVAGNNLLSHYQKIKTEQRLLDFTDLEWKAYKLLNETENAQWIQYKLDARIDHILIDEFQDTNPTQWQLILPLLQELASTENQGSRSVFLVGDTKQSIYRFRRAQPKLFDNAQQFLHDRLNATNTTLDTSWRSAPAVIDFVNLIYATGEMNKKIVSYDKHHTHINQVWGRVEILPLFTNDHGVNENAVNENNSNELNSAAGLVSTAQASNSNTQQSDAVLRNPLLNARIEAEDARYTQEAGYIAHKIQQLINQRTDIGPSGSTRALNYNDVIILIRHRTHAYLYEQALMKAGIPFTGTDKGTLLDTLEVRDMVALLEILITPYNNLSLATVLRSPLFSFDHEDLMALADLNQGSWFERLQNHAKQHPGHLLLQRANRLLSSWHSIAGKLPVHDLLDRIYSESNLISRYIAAYPSHLVHRVTSNLTRFIELALEIDSGRYPSIGRFLYRLQALRQHPQDAPDETPAIKRAARVRLMTIHAAKGLEAAVIFIADAANTSSSHNAYQAVVDWPANANKPASFFLAGKKTDQDEHTKQILQNIALEEERENANLLYVAVTRAKQLLYITGCEPRRGNNLGWYGAIKYQLDQHLQSDADHQAALNSKISSLNDTTFVIESGDPPTLQQPIESTAPAPLLQPMDIAIEPEIAIEPDIAIEPELSAPFSPRRQHTTIAPSSLMPHNQSDISNQASEQSATLDDKQRQRGIIIHRLLQHLTKDNNQVNKKDLNLKNYAADLSEHQFRKYIDEVNHVIQHKDTQFLFDSKIFQQAFNEVSITYELDKQLVIGIIDRVVVTNSKVYVIDYKTHSNTDPDYQNELATAYHKQLIHYGIGAQKIWPDRIIETKILFISNSRLVNLEFGNKPD